MTIATLTDYFTRRQAAERFVGFKQATNTVPGEWRSLWTRVPNVMDEASSPAIPTVAAACDATTDGALPQSPRNGGRFFGIDNYWLAPAAAINQGNTILLCDRLAHSGGLVGNSVLSQTTNLPSAALTRSVGGAGVFAAAEIYSALGVTDSVLTVTYTNSAGVGGRTGLAFHDGLSNWNVRPVALQAGDVGVRSVESVQWSISTGAAGDFGITLFRPLAVFFSKAERSRFYAYDAFLNLAGNMPLIESSPCIWPIFKTSLSALSNTYSFDLIVGSDV